MVLQYTVNRSGKDILCVVCVFFPFILNVRFLKKNQSTRPSEHPPVMGEKMSTRLGGIKEGCKYKTSSWHSNRFPNADNIGSTV